MCRREIPDDELGPELAEMISSSAAYAKTTALEDERRALIAQEWARGWPSDPREASGVCLSLAVGYLGSLGIPTYALGGLGPDATKPDYLEAFSSMVISAAYAIADAYHSIDEPVEEIDG